ncbi:MAG TPA: type I DNA topoisomerase, partial [Candidatus Acidoferrales bacterium]|nr:type I DNA topoisomerase [Candidatus Acidoferrales bacterium]
SAMARSLVIVESPAKAKTINKYLGRDYIVKASYGHVMDLPRKEIGILLPGEERKKRKRKAKAGAKEAAKKAPKPPVVNGENIFEPKLQIIPGKIKVINDLRRAANNAETIYLAADPDREGEAISAHLKLVLSKPARFAVDEAGEEGKNGNKNGKDAKAEKAGPAKKASAKDVPLRAADPKKIFRVTFNEITQKAVKAAFEHAGQVNENLVDAQQARRVLDRLVGYKVSPLLWDKVRRGLSAGRVQTVALRLIVEREQEIRAFVPKEYWTIHALVEAGAPPAFEAKLVKYQGADIEVPSEAEAQRIVGEVEKAQWQVAAVTQKERRRFAPPPFTTSKLQQAGYNRLRYTAKRTMALAQRLYEGVELGEEGSVALITYMRTDSVRVSADALTQVRELIPAAYGADYLPEKPNFYKSKKEAQEAHEAIRPTDVTRRPEDVRRYLEDDVFKLYQLIWQRFVASQMVPAVFDQTTIDIAAGDYTFRASGSVEKFKGYLAVYQAVKEDDEDAEGNAEAGALPQVSEGERLRLEKMRPEQHFTEPPPRYTEATLVRELEDKGIGRPSTYATIISTIVEREYVLKDQGRFTPTMLGEKVATLLVKSFEDIFDVNFTARLEEELDEIEEGKIPWRKSVSDFYKPFVDDLEKAEGEMASYKAGIPTGQKCEKCGEGELLERISRHGFFLGCSRYPDCDFIRDLSPETAGEEVESEAGPEYCENCGKEMAIKRGKWGAFLACTGYPNCRTTRRLAAGTRKALQPDQPLGENCPECGQGLVLKHGRYGEFIGCSGYPKCKYIRSKTLGIKCPKCGEGEFVERRARKGRMRVFYGCSRYPDCDFTTPHRPIAEACPKCGAAFVVEKRAKNAPPIRACLNEKCDWEMVLPQEKPAEAETAEVPAGAAKS